MSITITKPICVIDTETTGLHPSREIWEVAVTRLGVDGQLNRIEMMLPVTLDGASDEALEIGGFHDRHPQGDRGPKDKPLTPLDEASRTLHGFTADTLIVGSNPAFDTTKIDEMLHAHGTKGKWNHRLLDLTPLTIGYLIGRGVDIELPVRSSDELARMAGVDPASKKARHTAGGDVHWCLQWAAKILDLDIPALREPGAA